MPRRASSLPTLKEGRDGQPATRISPLPLRRLPTDNLETPAEAASRGGEQSAREDNIHPGSPNTTEPEAEKDAGVTTLGEGVDRALEPVAIGMNIDLYSM